MALLDLRTNRPLEFQTSLARGYWDTVTINPFEEVRTESFVAPLHSAAFLICDTFNLDGTLNHSVYKSLAELNAELVS